MRTRFGAALCAAAAGVLCAAAACVLFAGPAAALPTTTAGVYSETLSKTCRNATSCLLSFSFVEVNSAAQPLVVKHVACTVTLPQVTGVIPLTSAALGQTGETSDFSLGEYLGSIPAVQSNVRNGVGNVFQIAVDTQHVVPSGLHPAVLISYGSAANATLTCTVEGSIN